MASLIALLSMVCANGIQSRVHLFSDIVPLRAMSSMPPDSSCPGPHHHHDCKSSTSPSNKEAHQIAVSPSKSPSAPPRKSTNVTLSSSPMLAIKITVRQPEQISLQVSGKFSQCITITIEYSSISPSKSPEQSCNVMIKTSQN